MAAEFSRACAVRLVGVLAGVLTTGGCALGVQAHPVRVTASPSPEPPSSTTGLRDKPRTSTVSVFLVHDDRLLRVQRNVMVAPDDNAVVAGLVASVSDNEAREGLRSALPSSTKKLDVTIENRVARVQLPNGFDDLDVSEQILGVGQIVFTLTADGTVDAVQFTEDSRKVAVPNGSGRLLPGPVGRSDYAVIAPVASGS